MKYNFNIIASLIVLVVGIFSGIFKEYYLFFYSMIGACYLLLWEIMRILNEKYEK